MSALGERLRVDTGSMPWRDTPYPGVRWKKLAFDAPAGMSSVLLEFAAGAAYGAHRHPRGEQYLVLDGVLEDGAESYGKGTWVWHPPGSVHRPSSRSGCLLFVTLPAPIEIVERERGGGGGDGGGDGDDR